MHDNKIKIMFFYDENKKSPFKNFYQKLDFTYQIFIDNRFKRIIKDGNLGNVNSVGDKVFELKFDNGIRIYFGRQNNIFIIILAGSFKDDQQQAIEKAKQYWKIYLKGHGEKGD
jgi:putative addiction module killer protein